MQADEKAKGANELFPVFLKLGELDTLIVGGGAVCLEKLGALLRCSPDARVTIVAESVLQEIKSLVSGCKKIRLVERPFRVRDLAGKDLVILATDVPDLHRRIRVLA